MKILFINIALRQTSGPKYLPLGLCYIISAVKRAGYGYDLLDLDANQLSKEQTELFLRTHRYDIVAMGCIVTGYRHVKWLAQVIEEAFPDTIIIVGNSVASSIPNILLNKTKTDIAVIGEGDQTILDLLRAIQNKSDLGSVHGIAYKQNNDIKCSPRREVIRDIDQIRIPDWDIFNVDLYIASLLPYLDEPYPPIPREKVRSFIINTARGCLYNCTFCYHVFRGHKYRWRSPSSIIIEMRYDQERYGINHFYFWDELTLFSIKQAEAFADAMLASGLQVYWRSSCISGLFSKDEHVEVAKKLKDAGALGIGFSLESADPEILKWMNKKATIEAFSRQVEILRRAGLPVTTSIVLGYPNETEKTIKATIDCCIASGIYPSAGYLLPQPGTPMYDYALKHGYIKDEEEYILSMGDRQDLHLNMTQMSDHELEAIVQSELGRCSRALGLNHKPEMLLKTGYVRASKTD